MTRFAVEDPAEAGCVVEIETPEPPVPAEAPGWTEPSASAGNSRQLALATIAFGTCFYAWPLLGPLGPDLQDQLDLTDGELALTVSIPVVLGSLMRIPLGVLTDRHGGRIMFTVLMALLPLPLIGLALFNDSWAAVLGFGFLLGFAGPLFAIGIPFANAWYPRPARALRSASTGSGRAAPSWPV